MTMLRSVLGWVLLSITVATTVGCTDTEETAKCKLGEVLDCTCPNRMASVRACRPDGSWAGCQCAMPTAGTGAGMMNTAGTIAGMGGMSGMGASGTVADASMPDGGATDATPESDAMTDGAAPGEDSAVTPAYSDCTSGTCPMGETCDATGKYCAKSCTTMADCPDAPDGMATKTCGLSGKCALACDLLTMTCPTGMTCSGLIIGMTCTW